MGRSRQRGCGNESYRHDFANLAAHSPFDLVAIDSLRCDHIATSPRMCYHWPMDNQMMMSRGQLERLRIEALHLIRALDALLANPTFEMDDITSGKIDSLVDSVARAYPHLPMRPLHQHLLRELADAHLPRIGEREMGRRLVRLGFRRHERNTGTYYLIPASVEPSPPTQTT